MTFKNKPVFCGFNGCFSFFDAGWRFVFSFLVALSFLALLTCATVNSSSSLSLGSLKSSSLPESGEELLLFFWLQSKRQNL